MQKKTSHIDTDVTQKHEHSAVPHTENTSTSSNEQESALSKSAFDSGTKSAESDGNTPNVSMPTISIVAVPESAFSKRTGNPWIFASFFLLLIVIVAYASFAFATYINRSTPQKTLDAFCSALQKQDYKAAYAQFSSEMQLNFTESQFAQLFATDAVVRCSHGATSETGTSITTSLSLVHRASGGTNHDKVTLIKDGQGQWRINDLHTME